jgi:hypothetical protein
MDKGRGQNNTLTGDQPHDDAEGKRREHAPVPKCLPIKKKMAGMRRRGTACDIPGKDTAGGGDGLSVGEKKSRLDTDQGGR